MSKDVQDESKKTKKSKKDKKAAPIDEQPTPDTDKAEKKKKEKKKNRKADDAPATEADEPAAMAVDVEEPPKSSEKKKDKKKKRKEASGEVAASEEPVSMAVDSEEPGKSSKKDKKDRKRKRETDADVPETTAEDPTPSKKHKKKKHDGQSSSSSSSQPTTTLTTPSETPAPSSITSTIPCTPSEASAFLTKHAITIHTPPSHPPISPIISFSQLSVPQSLKDAFKGFKEPTPIQACAWPPALDGRDVVGIAETGSGKTLAFGIPALARLISSPPPPPSKKSKWSPITVLVVAPTRELAIQTHDALSLLGAPHNIASVAVFGGVDKGPQIKALTSAGKEGKGKVTRIVVGTPGRILDLVNEGVCDLSRVNYLVLDEADRMLDKGFENDIRKIISHTMQGSDRQTMMFSATWPEAVRRLASTFQRDPVRVTVGSDDLTANSRVEQTVEVFDDPREKDSRLTNTLKTLSHKKTSIPGESRILIFALYKKEASRVESTLRRLGFSVGALHGDLSQSARMDALEKFKTGETGLLVATDVAARGLDIPDVAAVVNYTFPLTIEDYIHRIGRTGRGGRTGKSITFFTGENHERALAGELARVLRESNFDEMADRLASKFPMTIKKKTHSSYGAFFRDDITAAPTKIVF
ncbi:hypothetical protein HYDPIDRAFT_32513 [Hydnomerulius pinastri MD-312]|uniref:RNA helicase n=1 Tax=Hydnomerulius pinastri MD-312 TaxID=994086 RepID=A0A0C9W9R5_9AGAM|nr:hypothetical protein HYDPIDRAFT_32513 [Hydnomerulius pinastri MD-312]